MLTKNDLLQSILHECDVTLHLAQKVPEGGLDYRQSSSQRTNLELLRYLSFCAIGGARSMIEGNWDGYHEWEQRHGELTLADIPGAMEAQKRALTEAFAGLSEDDLKRDATHPMGHTLPLGRALLEICLKWMVGYRMQLFCGLKAAGNQDLWTPDCWAGVSMPRETQPAT